MSRDKVADNILNFSDYKFNDAEIKVLRRSCRELYKCLRSIFSKPRVDRQISSVQSYKIAKERRYMYPERFYSFTDLNVSISVVRNSEDIYQIMVSGYRLNPAMFKAVKIVPTDPDSVDCCFRGGFYFYGSFVRSDFSSCLYLFRRIVLIYLFDALGLKYEHIYKQTEFIF